MDTTSVDLGDQASLPGQGSGTLEGVPTNPRRRLLCLLGRVGWGILLCLGLFILSNEIVEVSRVVTDFCQDYIAAQRILQGRPVYVPLRCFPLHNPAPREYDSHPPFSALLFTPLGFLPEFPAAVLWGFVSLGAYLASGALLLQALGWRSLRGITLFVWGSIFWQVFPRAEGAQNLTQIATFLLVAAWFLERKGKSRWSGWVIGVASLIKLWPMLLLVNASIKRQWGLVLVVSMTVVLGSLLALAILGPVAYIGYLGPAHITEGYWVPNGANVSLVGAVTRLFTGYWEAPLLPVLIRGLSLTQAILVGEGTAVLLLAATTAYFWWCWRRVPGEVTNLLGYGLLVTVLLLAFPVTWWWGILPILLPATTTVLALRQMPRPPRWWFALLAVSLLPLAVPQAWVIAFPEWLLDQHGVGLAGLGAVLFGVPTYALLAFAIAQALLLWWTTAPARVEGSAKQGRWSGT
jgi:alpha-1,2-mannosyltransferase